MASNNAYESGCMQEVLGETLRPGGFILTDTAAQFCGLLPQSSVLDLGCGRGATVNYLHEKYGISAIGIDPSEKLIEDARQNYDYASFVSGAGENLPFDDESFDCVFAECTLSLMDADKAIKEVFRVLKKNGWFVISDVYARNPISALELQRFSINSCMRGMHDLNMLCNRLVQAKFSIESSEDYSQYLKELVVKIGFSYGSMCDFWSSASDNCVNADDFNRALKQCKPGYFMLIARK